MIDEAVYDPSYRAGRYGAHGPARSGWPGGAIGTDNSPPAPGGNPPGLFGTFKTMDDMLLEVANSAPGFGGMYVNEAEQVLYVYAVDNKDAMTYRRAIAAAFGPERIPNGGVRVIEGTYTIPQLLRWYRLVNQHILPLPGVTATDLQEAGNHLWIGIKDESVRARVEKELDRLGIPRSAIVVEATGPIILKSHTLQSAVRPVDAGVQIDNENTTVIGDCTYGFTVLLDGTLGMVTNYHCTRTWATVDSDKFHQPSVSGTTYLVGTETIDPPFFNNTKDSRCPTGRNDCRYSDSAFVQSSGNLTLNRGYIARPTAMTNDLNNPVLTIDHNNPRFRITAISSPVVGNTVNKVGQKTGWTQGQVTATCVNVAGDSDYLICQHRASFGSIGGDSGSPVFRGSGDVTLLGIHWGGNSDTDNYFSPAGNVWVDLAPGKTFKACHPNFTC